MSRDPQAFLDAHQSTYHAALEAVAEGTFPHLHQIRPHLYLGDQVAAGILLPFQLREQPELRAATLAVLRAHRIQRVVCLCADEDAPEWQPFRDHGLRYLCCKLNDGSENLIQESSARFGRLVTEQVVSFVGEGRAAGEATLVHCASGCHRSASVVCAYLMIEERATLDQVFAEVFAIRPVVKPIYWRYLVNELEVKLGLSAANTSFP